MFDLVRRKYSWYLDGIMVTRENIQKSAQRGKPGVHFVITGGTIDSYYDGSKDTVVPNKISMIPEYIGKLHLHQKPFFTTVCLKDSRELRITDLRKIQKTIQLSLYKKIIVTHGTYTMPDTARYLKVHLKRPDQIIIFVGSMIPLFGFAPSDASFNLGYALAKFETLKPGIYVCMNGRVFYPEEIVKVLYEGRFASIFGKAMNSKNTRN